MSKVTTYPDGGVVWLTDCSNQRATVRKVKAVEVQHFIWVKKGRTRPTVRQNESSGDCLHNWREFVEYAGNRAGNVLFRLVIERRLQCIFKQNEKGSTLVRKVDPSLSH